MDQPVGSGIPAGPYEERRQHYLQAEVAQDRPVGNGCAEVFHQIARLELNRGPLWAQGQRLHRVASQHPAHWRENESYRDVELRAEVHDNIWICEMGDERRYRSFEHFVDAISSSPIQCEGLHVRYHSPSLGEVSFGWTEPLCASGKQAELHNYPRFDNPYCQAEVGERCYVITHGDDQLVLDFR